MTRVDVILVPVLVMAAAAAATAQSGPVLNVIELRQAMSSAEPGDHARLSGHFAALAETYAGVGARHAAMSTAFGGNPNRSWSVPASAHCARLAVLNLESATTLRDLALHHERLAFGVSSTAPIDGARFENGEGAPTPTDGELAALAAGARTPDDHRALAEYFLTAAERHTGDADAHARMAQAYRGNANRRGGDPAARCDRLVTLAREAARDALAAATMHAQLADVG